MANDHTNKIEKTEEKPSLRPEPETLHTTDPQKHMEGPVSSLMHDTGESFDTNKSEEEANKERDKNM